MAKSKSYIDIATTLTTSFAIALLIYLLANWEKWERLLTPFLIDRWAIRLCTISLLVLLFLLPFFFSKKSSTLKSLNKNEIKNLIEAIENKINSEYRLHQINILENKIKDAVSREASKGARIPQGSLNGVLSDIFLGEIGVFSKILQLTIKKSIVNIEKRNILNPIESTITKLLNQHKENVLKMYMSYVYFYFSNAPFQDFYAICEESFLKVAEVETAQRIKRINSLLKLEIFT